MMVYIAILFALAAFSKIVMQARLGAKISLPKGSVSVILWQNLTVLRQILSSN